MKLNRSMVFVMFIALFALSTGCASFRSGDSKVSSWPPQASSQKKTISVVVNGQASLNGKDVSVPPAMLKKWTEATMKAYQDSGLFSQVREGLEPSDLRAEVTIMDRGEGSIGLAMLTGLTLYMVPSKATDHLTVATVVKDKNGKVLGKVEKSETLVMWQQFFLLFAMPFNFPGSVAKETLYDLSRETINISKTRGYF